MARGKKDSKIETKFYFTIREINRYVNRIDDLIKEGKSFVLKEIKPKLCNLSDSLEELIFELDDEENLFYNEYTDTSEKVLDACAKIEGFICRTNTSETSASEHIDKSVSNETQNIRLPKFEIPIFGGNLDDWITFKEIFSATIDSNKNLSSLSKFQYLVASVKSDAAKLIKGFPVSGDFYKQAWETLVSRYDDNKLLANNQLSKIFNIRSPKVCNGKYLLEILDTCNEAIRNLDILGFKGNELVDLILIYTIQNKLDNSLRTQWELKTERGKFPTFAEFSAFLENHARSVQNLKDSCFKVETTSKGDFKPQKRTTFCNTASASKLPVCNICKSSHALYKCPNFLGMSLDQRWEFVKTNKLCINCLRNNHLASKCLITIRCKSEGCNKNHHTLLHRPKPFHNPEANGNSNQETNLDSPCLANNIQTVTTLLSTALIYIKSANQDLITCRALIDSGSQRCMISSTLATKLNLKVKNTNHIIRGINNSVAETSLKETNMTIYSHSCDESFEMNALVVKNITMNLPNFRMKITKWPHLEGLVLADPNFHISSPVEVLIGADLFMKIISGEKIIGPKGTPSALKSKLGWLLSGPIHSLPVKEDILSCHSLINSELNSSLQKFWQIESVPESSAIDPVDDNFRKSVTRDSTGRYVVNLPFKSTPVLGDSKFQALKRFQYLEAKLRKDPEFKTRYSEFMREYLSLNHMEIVPDEEEDIPNQAFLPHHGVLREESLTTKLRVVFDASSKDSSGNSLNDFLEVGPKLLPEIFKILIHFRTYRIAFTADVEKMFRQILVTASHRDYQRIVWRFEEQKPISTYHLNTVTYGTACAPYLAIKTLHKLAEDCQVENPRISKIIRENFYMDDLLCGASSPEEASKLIYELNQIMESGGFTLRKWASNSPEAIGHVTEERRLMHSNGKPEDEQVVKVLGLTWNSSEDTIQLQIAKTSEVKTKRDLLSFIARTFDPLGLLSPSTIMLKILMQELWKDKLSWEDEIPPKILDTWESFRNQYNSLKDIRIPRFINIDESSNIQLQLHGFADASLKAYAAVLYLIKLSPSGNTSQILAAKTRVAPLSMVTLPRLELSAALLLSQLTLTVMDSLPINLEEIHLWSDSQIALCWIHSPPLKGNQFVSNRVHKIKSLVPKAQWHHITGKWNPADCASRGILPEKLLHHDLWWYGPYKLWDNSYTPFEQDSFSDENEEVLIHTAVEKDIPEFLLKFSSYTKLINVTAYCLRFLHNCRNPKERFTEHLTANEIKSSLLHIIRLLQAREFPKEIKSLQKKSPLPTSSKLLTLNVFLDKSNILRVGGRLFRQQNLTHDQKHPILLPKENLITDLVIEHYHQKHFHAGPQLTLALIRQKFWFTSGRSKVRQVIHRCILCKKLRATSCQQIMADLPSERINPSRCFQKIGIDFCGPVTTKPNLPRSKTKLKSYICVIICMCTKAVHLEAVSDLSTQALLACLKRFTSRRGLPSDVYSDNGKNFVGLSNELKSLFSKLKSEEVMHFSATNEINWHFIPPYSPNFGGIWESAVKSAKGLLVKASKSAVLNFEELSTFLCQIEACLNSRPLVPMSSDPSELSVLTPGHFIIGSPLLDIPETSNCSIGLNDRWKLLQKMRKEFWDRWSQDYLNQLQQRPKAWSLPRANIQKGDLVAIHEPQLPPLKWLLGRVIQCFPGADGRVRVVSIKTASGEMKRPISKVTVLLPAPEDVQS